MVELEKSIIVTNSHSLFVFNLKVTTETAATIYVLPETYSLL